MDHEVSYMTYGAQFMLAWPTRCQGGHIRTDAFYERWSRRPGTIARLLPVSSSRLLFILYAGAVETRFAWEIGERTSLRIGSVPFPMYLLKAVIPVSAALLLLQGLSELIRCGRVIRRRDQ